MGIYFYFLQYFCYFTSADQVGKSTQNFICHVLCNNIHFVVQV